LTSEEKKRQMQEQSVIIQMLTSAGWKKTGRGELSNVANLEYQNKMMDLEVDYHDEDGSIYLSMYDHDENGIELIIYFHDKLGELLSVISSFQDEISSTNYKDYLEKILTVCPCTYLDTDGEHVLLTNDTADSQSYKEK
jgi:hypothetical protein